jgi:putative peptide zinc metalloprotease protein
MDRTLTQLPRLREDLRLLRAGASLSGAPSWVLFDPVANSHFQIGFEMFQILSVWNKSDSPENLLSNVMAKYGRLPAEAEVDAVMLLLRQGKLLADEPQGGWRELHQASLRKQPLAKRLFSSYIFFKLPLFSPEQFLKKTWPLVSPFASRLFLIFTAIAALLGLFLVSRQWEAFVGTVSYVFTFEGFLLSILAVVITKTLHELGHGYVAHRLGCHVPVMGIAFMAFMPMPYTDVSDAWKLRNRRDRLAIDLAGVLVELILGAWCLLLWSFLPDGAIRSAAFVLAGTSWIMSLAFNLNPLMRFDGYYVLSDYLNMPNLQDRAFAHMRHRLRRHLFGIESTEAEHFATARSTGLFLFAVAVAIYRFSLYLGIALLVYHFAIKIVGVAMFMAEIYLFIVKPVLNELNVWWTMRNRLFLRPRGILTSGLALSAAILFFVPVATGVTAPAVMEPGTLQHIFPNEPARLQEILVRPGQQISVGDVLFRLEQPGLAFQKRRVEADINLRMLRLARIASDAEDLSQKPVLERELQSLRANLKGIDEIEANLTIRAGFSGVVSDLAPHLYPGKWVSRTEQLAILTSPDGLVTRGFVDGQDLHRITAGVGAKFVPDDITAPSRSFTLDAIATSSSDQIDLPSLTSAWGGRIAVDATDARMLKPISAQYAVKASASETDVPPRQVQRGVLIIDSSAESMAARTWRQVMRVLIRESGA